MVQSLRGAVRGAYRPQLAHEAGPSVQADQASSQSVQKVRALLWRKVRSGKAPEGRDVQVDHVIQGRTVCSLLGSFADAVSVVLT